MSAPFTGKERPILMSGPLVLATLDGTKTQTRRPIKGVDGRNWIALRGGIGSHVVDGAALAACPYGVVGDRLWVRETWRICTSVDRLKPNTIGDNAVEAGWDHPWAPIEYVADGARRDWETSFGKPGITRPSIHMPRWACRLVLDIVDVRVQRLHDITEEDAVAEGFKAEYPVTGRTAFLSAWDGIYGGDETATHLDPLVWAITYKRVKP